jgi:hypothetical protein
MKSEVMATMTDMLNMMHKVAVCKTSAAPCPETPTANRSPPPTYLKVLTGNYNLRNVKNLLHVWDFATFSKEHIDRDLG